MIDNIYVYIYMYIYIHYATIDIYRGMTNEDLSNVRQLIQNTMQASTTFEKQFIAHNDTETTH